MEEKRGKDRLQFQLGLIETEIKEALEVRPSDKLQLQA